MPEVITWLISEKLLNKIEQNCLKIPYREKRRDWTPGLKETILNKQTNKQNQNKQNLPKEAKTKKRLSNPRNSKFTTT